jgi:transportin-1
VQPLIERLIPILLHPKAPRSLHENAAVSIGRIGLTHPDVVAPHLPEFAQAWCQALYEIRDNEEKDSAFRGFCTLVQANPPGIAKVRCVNEWMDENERADARAHRACCGSATRSCGGTSRRRS